MFGIFHNKNLENNTYYVPETKLALTHLSYKLTLQKNSQDFFSHDLHMWEERKIWWQRP